MRKTLLSVSLISLALAGCAGNPQQGEFIGGLTGAVVGSQFGGGMGQLAATFVGAAIGSQVGKEVSTPRGNVYIVTPGGYGMPGTVGEDHCTNDQLVSGANYGVAAAYCRGLAERRIREQQMMERNAYQRGYFGK